MGPNAIIEPSDEWRPLGVYDTFGAERPTEGPHPIVGAAECANRFINQFVHTGRHQRKRSHPPPSAPRALRGSLYILPIRLPYPLFFDS